MRLSILYNYHDYSILEYNQSRRMNIQTDYMQRQYKKIPIKASNEYTISQSG